MDDTLGDVDLASSSNTLAPVYVAKPVCDNYSDTDLAPIRRLCSSNMSVYSYDLGYSRYRDPHETSYEASISDGVVSVSSTAVAIANEVLPQSVDEEAQAATTASVTENPQAWTSYDYPVPVFMLGNQDLLDFDIASPTIDYAGPRHPVFDVDEGIELPADRTPYRGRNCQARSNFQRITQDEQHPYHSAVSLRPQVRTVLNVNNPDENPIGTSPVLNETQRDCIHQLSDSIATFFSNLPKWFVKLFEVYEPSPDEHMSDQ